MSSPDPVRSASIRRALQEYVTRRLNAVLVKIDGTDAAAENERKTQRDFYQLQQLLDSGADCVGQIQMATHILKGIHPYPKVKVATNLNVDCVALPDLPMVSSHVLGKDHEIDATGNGAFNKRVYEIYLLLMTKFDGRSVLDRLHAEDADAIAALSESPMRAAEIRSEEHTSELQSH